MDTPSSRPLISHGANNDDLGVREYAKPSKAGGGICQINIYLDSKLTQNMNSQLGGQTIDLSGYEKCKNHI